MQKLIHFFQNIETKNRVFLSRHKFMYALIGGAGVILYWRGVWQTADLLYSWGVEHRSEFWGGLFEIIFSGPGSIVFGALILIMTGLLVQEFIGDDVIISGLKRSKKLIDKTEEEILKELKEEEKNKNLLKEINNHLNDLEDSKFCVLPDVNSDNNNR